MTKVPLLRNNENFPTSSNNSRNTIVINSIFSLVYMHALFTGSRWGFSLLLAERFLAARSKEKRLYSQAIEKLETVANGTEISPKSFLKFWKLLIFRNANLSTENSSNSRSKVEWKENFRENSFEKIWVYLSRLTSVLEILEDAVPFATGSCRKFKADVLVNFLKELHP